MVRIVRSVAKGLDMLDYEARAEETLLQKADLSAKRKSLPWLWGRLRRQRQS